MQYFRYLNYVFYVYICLKDSQSFSQSESGASMDSFSFEESGWPASSASLEVAGHTAPYIYIYIYPINALL